MIRIKAIIGAGTCLLAVTFFTLACRDDLSGQQPASSSSIDQSKIFWSSPEEELKPTRWDEGNTTISNESRLDLFWESARDVGGGYVGVGSTQNFLLAAWANSEWIWLMDFTRIVVATNKVHIAFIKESEVPEKYLDLWKEANNKPAIDVITKHYGAEKDIDFIVSSFKKARPYLNTRFRLLKMLTKKRSYKIWLNDQVFYDRIRNLALKGRIRPIRGDMLGKTTLRGIGEAARKMGVPIRIFYPSNAEEYQIFRPYPNDFRENLLSLPTDNKSVVLRTISKGRYKLPWAPDSQMATSIGFHYNVQPLPQFQGWLKRGGPQVNVVNMLFQGSEILGTTGFSRVIKEPEEVQKKPAQKPKKKPKKKPTR